MHVDQIIRLPAHSGGFRVWRVTGVFLGATHQESVASLETLDRTANVKGQLLVPIEMLEQLPRE